MVQAPELQICLFHPDLYDGADSAHALIHHMCVMFKSLPAFCLCMSKFLSFLIDQELTFLQDTWILDERLTDELARNPFFERCYSVHRPSGHGFNVTYAAQRLLEWNGMADQLTGLVAKCTRKKNGHSDTFRQHFLQTCWIAETFVHGKVPHYLEYYLRLSAARVCCL